MRYKGPDDPPAGLMWVQPDPPDPREGHVWYDTTTGEIKMRLHGQTVLVSDSQF